MIGRVRLVLLFCAVGLLAGGCAYTKDRLNDLADIGGVRFIAGGGGKAGLGIGPYRSPVTLGWYNFSKYGWDGRSIGRWDESGGDLIIPLEYEVHAVGGTETVWDWVEEYYQIVAESKGVHSYRKYQTYTFHNYGDVQFTLAFCIGAEANMSPKQMIDFVVGFTTIDINHDDHDSRAQDKQEQEEAENMEDVASIH